MSGGILLILAHPDDETFIAAGTACRYGAAGVRVALVCATLGEAGKLGEPPVATREGLSAARELELRSACDILGIDLIGLLGYHDRQLADAPVDLVRGRPSSSPLTPMGRTCTRIMWLSAASRRMR